MQYILISLILAGLWELSIGIKQLSETILNNHSYYSIYGTFSHPTPYALLITIILPIAWFYALQGKILLGKDKFLIQKVKVILSYAYIIMSIIILPFSMSRTSWIAGIIACGVTTFYYLKSNAEFLLEYGQCLSKTGQYEKSNHILQEGTYRSGDPMFFNLIGINYQNIGEYQLAESMFYKAYYRIPHKIYPLYLLMNLYKELNREKEMTTMAHRILNQRTKVNSPETLFIKEKTKELLDTYFQNNHHT